MQMCILSVCFTFLLPTCSVFQSVRDPTEKKGTGPLSSVSVFAACVATVQAPLWFGIVWLPAV